MAVVALVALNCAALRTILPGPGRFQAIEIVFIRLLPLANASIIGAILLALRYPIVLRRRLHCERIGILPGFVIASAMGLIVMSAACVLAHDGVLKYLECVLRPVDVFLR